MRRLTSRTVVLLMAFWSIIFVATVAATEVGALFVRDTILITLFLVCALALCSVAPLVGVVIGLARRNWWPFVVTAVNLSVSVGLFLVALALVPRQALIDRFRGEPVLVSHYDGTQNSATLTLRRNGDFDLFWAHWPGSYDYFAGTYERSGDKLSLRFRGDGPTTLRDRAILLPGAVAFDAHEGGPARRFIISANNDLE